jgi:hypothetical protein
LPLSCSVSCTFEANTTKVRLGERESGTAHLEEAAKAIELALSEYHLGKITEYDAYFSDVLNRITELIDGRRRMTA